MEFLSHPRQRFFLVPSRHLSILDHIYTKFKNIGNFQLFIYDPKNLNVETGPKRTSILDDLKFHFLLRNFKGKKNNKNF